MPRKLKSIKPLIYVFCEGESEQAYTDYLKKEKVISEVKKLIPTYAKGDYASTEKIAVHYPVAIDNSKKTLKALLSDGLPGLGDTDMRNQWLNTKSVTFSNVYEAIEFLQELDE